MAQKVVLITGASSGIGKAIAEHSAAKGHRVYGASRSLRPEESPKGGFIPLQMDVKNEDSVREGIERIEREEGKLDCLVNSAGIGLTGALEETPLEDAKSVFDTNLFGPMNTTRIALPIMRREGAGKIVNIGSIGAQVALPFRGVYCSSKAALESLTRSLSMEVRSFGIEVFLIHPGDFSTNINRNRRVVNGGNGSIYQENSERVREMIEQEVTNGLNPGIIGDLVLGIIEGKRRRRHYRVGKWLQRLTPLIQSVLPSPFFEKQLMRYYRIDP